VEKEITRRSFIKTGAKGVALTAAFSSLYPDLFAQNEEMKPVRIGVIGSGGRGTHLLRILLSFPGVSVPAICDINEKNLNHAIDLVKEIKGTTPVGYSKGEYDYRNLLKRDDLDGVLIATPQQWHATMTVDALKAGKHVGCEVPAAWELGQLWEMVKAKEESGKHYMLLENYVYAPHHMAILNMVEKGLFGDPYYALCSYIHATPELYFESDGTPAWRGWTYINAYGNIYPTHALGPVSKWLSINDGDCFDYCTSMMSEPAGRVMRRYAIERCGKDSNAANQKYIAGEFVPTLIKTVKGSVIQVNFDGQSPRPADNYYLLQGTMGIYKSQNGIHIDHLSPDHAYEDANKYMEKYAHAYWTKNAEKARDSGHEGGDWFVMKDFFDMVRLDKEPWIDIYDAAAWSSIIECSRLSIDQKDAVQMPDFTSGKWKDPSWREGNLKPV